MAAQSPQRAPWTSASNTSARSPGGGHFLQTRPLSGRCVKCCARKGMGREQRRPQEIEILDKMTLAIEKSHTSKPRRAMLFTL